MDCSHLGTEATLHYSVVKTNEPFGALGVALGALGHLAQALPQGFWVPYSTSLWENTYQWPPGANATWGYWQSSGILRGVTVPRVQNLLPKGTYAYT